MRRDGVFVPFAAFDGDWSAPWPATVDNIELPIALDAVPRKWWGGELPARWTFFPARGFSPTPTPLSVSGPVLVMAGVERRLGVRSDYRSPDPAPPPFELPYPKEGLAIAGDLTPERISPVSNQSPTWRTMPESILDDIEEAESKTIAALRQSARWVHPHSRETRHKVKVELEAWYTSMLEQPGFAISYIEAVKKYPALPEDEGCGLETFITGWLHVNSRIPKPKAELTARITFCDRVGASYMLPLGRVRVKNRTHWIFQLSSWEREWYVVAEATPGRVRYVVEYNGGGRPRPRSF